MGTCQSSPKCQNEVTFESFALAFLMYLHLVACKTQETK